MSGTPAVAVTARTEPGAVRFGDAFRYVVQARAHGSAALRVVGDTGPFAVVGAPRTSQHRAGNDTVVTLVEQLACLDRGCLAGRSPRAVALPRATATAGGVSARSQPAVVRMLPRVPASAVSAARAPYVRQTSIPPASTALPLGLAAALVAAVAILALAGAGALAWGELRRRRAGRAPQGWTGTRLELVLRFLRDSAARSPEDRRRAADFAARAVDGPLADEATRVAWGPPAPAAHDVTSLAEDVERAGSRA